MAVLNTASTQSGLFSLVREFLASPFARIFVSLESGSGFEIRRWRCRGLFFRATPLTWVRVVCFFRATIRGPLPCSRVQTDFDLALCAWCAIFSSCLERHWCLHPSLFRHFRAIGRCRDLFRWSMSFVLSPRFFFVPTRSSFRRFRIILSSDLNVKILLVNSHYGRHKCGFLSNFVR